MKQSDIDRAVAQATGETVRWVKRQGFSLLSPEKRGDLAAGGIVLEQPPLYRQQPHGTVTSKPASR